MASIIGDLVSEPSSLLIAELTGSKNMLELIGRALPYRPISFEGGMRAEFTWYPGNPIATVQMLGADEKTTTINGMWKDRFIRTTTDLGLPVFGQAGIAALNGATIADVRSLVRAVEGFRLRGQLLELSWDEIVRQGILVRFKQTWLRREDVEWEMEFQWISRGEPLTPVAFGISLPSLDIATEILNVVNAIKALAEAPFALITQITNDITNAIDTVSAASDALTDIAKKAEAATLAPLEAARATIATFQTIKKAAGDLSDQMESLPARAMRQVVSITSVNQGEALEAEHFKRAMRQQARKLRALAAQRETDVSARTIEQPNIQTYVVRENQDLRDVSRQFYGTPEQWRALAQYNGIHGSRLTGGTILLIPPLIQPGRV